jgi:hypothetical protein
LRPANRQRLRERFVEILDIIVKPSSVDIKEFRGSEDPSEYCEWDRRERARIIMEHNIDNETQHKIEYAWEADAWVAWAYVFNNMRMILVLRRNTNPPPDEVHRLMLTIETSTTILPRCQRLTQSYALLPANQVS